MLDPRTNQPTNPFQLSDGTRHRTHSYHDETWEATNSGLWPSKIPEFRTELNDVGDESGICSPPLWKTSPPTSPQHGGGRNHHHTTLSPSSRTQAIVTGQRELMEMVKNMPESSYELSLKDLVEHQRVDRRKEKSMEERSFRKEGGGGRKVARVKKRSGGGKVDHHGGGFYLKMVLPPFSLGSKDKKMKKNENLVNGSSKVSPKPSGSDKEWWKKSPLGCRESDSGASSINSGSMKSCGSSSSSSTNSNGRHEMSGGRCWPFIRKPKSKR